VGTRSFLFRSCLPEDKMKELRLLCLLSSGMVDYLAATEYLNVLPTEVERRLSKQFKDRTLPYQAKVSKSLLEVERRTGLKLQDRCLMTLPRTIRRLTGSGVDITSLVSKPRIYVDGPTVNSVSMSSLDVDDVRVRLELSSPVGQVLAELHGDAEETDFDFSRRPASYTATARQTYLSMRVNWVWKHSDS
jgi:hypothetical protein